MTNLPRLGQPLHTQYLLLWQLELVLLSGRQTVVVLAELSVLHLHQVVFLPPEACHLDPDSLQVSGTASLTTGVPARPGLPTPSLLSLWPPAPGDSSVRGLLSWSRAGLQDGACLGAWAGHGWGTWAK